VTDDDVDDDGVFSKGKMKWGCGNI